MVDKETRVMLYFAVIQEYGKNWNHSLAIREQQHWDEHAQFMDALVDDGVLVLGGPLDGGEQVLLIINAPDEQAIADRFATEPWITMGLRVMTTVKRWEILLDSRKP
jgi:uncharacterized protein YciI